MKRIFIPFLSLALLFSCGNSDQNAESEGKNEAEIITEPTVQEKTIPDGDYVEYHENGALSIQGQILNGRKEGLWVSFHDNGNKQSESTYSNGVLHGKTATFHPNGQLMYLGYFKHGERDAVWAFYNENGTQLKEVIYDSGKEVK